MLEEVINHLIDHSLHKITRRHDVECRAVLGEKLELRQQRLPHGIVFEVVNLQNLPNLAVVLPCNRHSAYRTARMNALRAPHLGNEAAHDDRQLPSLLGLVGLVREANLYTIHRLYQPIERVKIGLIRPVGDGDRECPSRLVDVFRCPNVACVRQPRSKVNDLLRPLIAVRDRGFPVGGLTAYILEHQHLNIRHERFSALRHEQLPCRVVAPHAD